ncbi:MAG TPA: glycosyltransferase family 2 protein [Polyangiaceae bacterium]|nr:glycosyltransferase family 2 protein [Polyangiaceae bacterium]
MKLLIQIPCLNEQDSLPVTLRELPTHIDGIDSIEVLVIDDGSSDNTREVARQHGVHHVVGFSNNRGLAAAFMLGIQSCLERGADVIVNTDADNQYHAGDIAKLVEPIVSGSADIVIGARPIETIEHFSLPKKLLQKLGSWVVKRVSGTTVADAPSGFRAMSRQAASSLNVFNRYTYTLETIIQAGQKNLKIISVPIRVNADMRPSRLVSSVASYVRKSFFVIVRIFIIYQPFRFFMLLGSLIFMAGATIGMRFVYYYFTSSGAGKIQSLILAAVLLIIGFQTILLAFLADLLSVNRQLLEELQAHQRANKTLVERHHASVPPSPPTQTRAREEQAKN